MFSDGPWNSALASLLNWMSPRGRSGIRLLRVQTTNRVDPGLYSQRNTAFPRSDRNVNVGSGNVKLGAPPPALSVTVSGAGLAAGVTVTVPKSRPYSSLRTERGAANSR